MKRSRFSEEQIIGILKEYESGVPVADLCRKHGVSDASVYKWKAEYGVWGGSEAKRLKVLEEENAKLKRLAVLHPSMPLIIEHLDEADVPSPSASSMGCCARSALE